ncbi:mitochondrial ribonuclease P protein 1 homolog [Bacillus rossius redtenbacheri]|uniref:mitochondrial ribonuclease P protein 1 homolog n=1 Tax=Bacillus rossius redtenbacheri TaxID=93214 RepID=UPI002FDD140F
MAVQFIKWNFLAAIAEQCCKTSKIISRSHSFKHPKTTASCTSVSLCCRPNNFSTMGTKIESSVPVVSGLGIDTSSVTNGQPELEKKLKLILLEMEVSRQEGKKVPSKVSVDQLKELVSLNTISSRKKYLSFLFEVEIKKENRKRKKEDKRLQHEERKPDDDDGHIKYGLSNNTLFFRLYDRTINNFYHNRLMHAMQFNQKIVFDCGFDQHMTRQEAKNCAKQLLLTFSENRIYPDPFDLYFCNVNKESLTMKALLKHIPSMYDEHFPLNVTEKSYLDLFPKENLVYLTPHCREELTTYDHDAVYIVGAMVDKANQEPLSLAKAKKERLKMAKLPLDRYLMWGSGSGKTLTLNQMILIMLDIRSTGDWNKALMHVPRRKLFDSDKERVKSLGRTINKYSSFRVDKILKS